jgi:exosortase/archaeosortase family protein
LAGGLLSLGIEDVRSEGVRIVLDGQDILVDLPCSGARGLLLVLLCFFATAALTRPAPARAAVGLVVTLAAAGMTNAARIAGLALGIARPAYVGGIDVMEAPWHDVIGVVALGVGLAVVLAWGRSIPPRARTSDNRSYRAAPSNTPVESWRSWLLAATVLGAALALPTIPAHPLDVAAPADPPALPNRILAHGRVDIAPQPHEREYFATYGGGISKASFGPLGLMTVRTSAPLRHLHDPDVCARAAGHAVRYLGLVSPVTAAYRATSPTGEHHRIHVTYVSDTGYIASNVATTVWHWMHGRVRTWTLIQRSYPETLAERERLRLDAAVLALFDIDNHRVQHP